MESQIRSADQILKMVIENPESLEALKANPLQELERLRTEAVKNEPVYYRDKLLYRIAITVLSLLALTTALGSIVLVFNGKPIPEVLVALGSAAVGALVGLFAPSPAGK